MDIQALRERAKSARTLTIEHDGAHYTLVIPSDFEWRTIIKRHREDDSKCTRALVDAALVGWSGVRVADAVPESDKATESLPFSGEARALLLDYRVDILSTLETALILEFHSRREAREAAQKNSESASPSN